MGGVSVVVVGVSVVVCQGGVPPPPPPPLTHPPPPPLTHHTPPDLEEQKRVNSGVNCPCPVVAPGRETHEKG